MREEAGVGGTGKALAYGNVAPKGCLQAED